jgi:hypothetical protein
MIVIIKANKKMKKMIMLVTIIKVLHSNSKVLFYNPKVLLKIIQLNLVPNNRQIQVKIPLFKMIISIIKNKELLININKHNLNSSKNLLWKNHLLMKKILKSLAETMLRIETI